PGTHRGHRETRCEVSRCSHTRRPRTSPRAGGAPFTAKTRSQGATLMSVKKEPSGRRSTTIEFEVAGTPEEVWQAIATGPGISSWFVPTEIEERDGKPVAVKYKFGPGVEP